MKWLRYRDGVQTTPTIVRAAEAIDPFFEGETSYITSGLRTAEEQLQIIVEKVERYGVGGAFEEYQLMAGNAPDAKLKVDGKELYWWQRAWSKLLNIGDIVNPPLPAEVLFDYFPPGSYVRINKKGQIIGISVHMKGHAIDIGGGPNLHEKAKRVLHAHQSGKAFIQSFLIERVNNAVHINLEPA